jgi:hypothetical protein
MQAASAAVQGNTEDREKITQKLAFLSFVDTTNTSDL